MFIVRLVIFLSAASIVLRFPGLIKELDMHKYDNASKHLASHATYILVEKLILPPGDDEPDSARSAALSPSYHYTPLLSNYTDLFPNFRLRVRGIEKKTKRRLNSSKSPSSGGGRGAKSSRVKPTNVRACQSRRK